MRKKEIVEKSKYWRRNDGFSFVPEVKVTHLIDSPIQALNKSGCHLFFFKFMTSIAERLQPPSLSFDSRDSTMSGREAKSGHYESLYSILFLYIKH